MKLVQAFRKLSKNKLMGFDENTSTWVDTLNPCIFESSGRWISERVGFNARRVLLAEFPVYPAYNRVKIGDDSVEHILYSEQRNISRSSAYLYDYTLLDKTDDASTIAITTSATASGMGGTKTETESSVFPVHMIRFASTGSEVADHVDFSRLYAFAPGGTNITEDMELKVGNDRFTISEVVEELLCVRLSLTKR